VTDGKLRIEDRVRWGDVDAAGIIFYGAYIRFFDIAESELFREIGLPYSTIFDELDVWLPRVHLECDFKVPARLDDLLEVAVWVAKIGTKSLRLEFEVSRKRDGVMVATAHFVLVAVARATMEGVAVPEGLRERLRPYTTQDSLRP
jgi:YbgC/YbaW family acyl-CoA thioester hydrolase